MKYSAQGHVCVLSCTLANIRTPPPAFMESNDQLIYNCYFCVLFCSVFNREKSLPEMQWKLQDMYWIPQLYRLQGWVKVREWRILLSHTAQGVSQNKHNMYKSNPLTITLGLTPIQTPDLLFALSLPIYVTNWMPSSLREVHTPRKVLFRKDGSDTHK